MIVRVGNCCAMAPGGDGCGRRVDQGWAKPHAIVLVFQASIATGRL